MTDDLDIGASIKRIMAKAAERGPIDNATGSSDAVRVEAVLDRWGVPRRARKTIVGDLGETKALVAIREFAASEEWAAVLAGGPGTGKTTAAAVFVAGNVGETQDSDRLRRRWWSAAELSTSDYYGADGFGSLLSVPQLVIDDLGVEFMDKAGMWRAKVDQLIDYRYANELKTIITTNLAPDALAKRYGSRAVDRLREGGRWVSVGSGTMRGLKS